MNNKIRKEIVMIWQISHRWDVKLSNWVFNCVCLSVYVCSVCLQGWGSKGHSCLKSLLGQRITWGPHGLHTHAQTHRHIELMVEVYSRALGSELTGLKLHFSTWQNRSREELLFHFEFGLGVKVPSGAILCTTLLCSLSITP